MNNHEVIITERDYTNNLKKVYEVSYALATTKDISTLLEKIMKVALELTGADGGTIYRANDETKELNFEILLNNSLNIHVGGTSAEKINLPPLKMYLENGEANKSLVAVCCALDAKLVNIPDAYDAQGFDFSGTRKFDELNKYHSKSFLTVPLIDHEGDLVGVMQLINKLDEKLEIIKFTHLDELLTTALSSQAAVAIVRMQLIAQQQKLFEAFIKLINNAIDEKSPHTAGHCERVPIITMMIAESLNRINYGPFKDFNLTNKDFYELEIASLLHDCGKITTPVHIVDKGTKLETITDRIKNISTRFLNLQTQIFGECVEAKLALRPCIVPHEEQKVEKYYRDRLKQLKEEYEFVAHCNTGSEKTDDEDIDKLKKIRAKHQFTDSNGVEQHILTQDELTNLSIIYGTLTNEERNVINYHITSTIKMLESLPWPKHLKNVPEFAGGHHERMDGKGYPRGIAAKEMSVQARAMAVADVFEALTAPDRPYKKGHMLSTALDIMGNMTKGGHLDPDIFQVFIDEKIYLNYAKKYLAESQLDDVDITKIPGFVPNVTKLENAKSLND